MALSLERFPWWAWPLLMCLVLTGIHGYLGIHVLKRKVIFVDLAMAQIAALGAAFAILQGYDPKHEENAFPIYLFSLGFTLVGAAVISLARMRHERVPQEAFIGIVYASASALAILLLSQTPTEGEQIKYMLVGSLLTVRWEKVALTALIYSGIGLFHWFFRKRFFQISEDPEGAERSGISVRLWDFLFYVSFGFVITSSVSIAGVLLVFSFLVVPGVIAVMFVDDTRLRIWGAWLVGTVVSVVGVVISYAGDYPTGPSIVAAFTALLILAGLANYVIHQDRRGQALARLAAGALVVAAGLWGTRFLRKEEEAHSAHKPGEAILELLAALESDNENTVVEAIGHIVRTRDAHAVEPLLGLVAKTKSDRVIEKAAEALARLEISSAVPVLKQVAGRDLDTDLLVHLARDILDLRDPAGLAILIRVLDGNPPNISREEALRLAAEKTGAPIASAADLKKWWAGRGTAARWKEQAKRFE